MKRALLGTSALDQHQKLVVEKREPKRALLTHADMKECEDRDEKKCWAKMKAKLIAQGIPFDRLKEGGNFKMSQDKNGIWLEFP